MTETRHTSRGTARSKARDTALNAAIETKRQRLSRRYITALALVAFFTISGYVGLRSVIIAQQDDAVTINVSGRQRMLSQRIAFFAVRYATARNAEERAASREALETARDLIETSHIALMEGDAELGLDGLHENNSPAISALYNMAPYAINRQMREFLLHVEELLATPVNELNTDQQNLRAIEAAAEGPLLSALNAAVKRYEIESRERIDTLARLELAIVIVTIVILLFEALLIFQPMVNALIREELHLRRSEEELIAARQETDDILDSVDTGFFLLLPADPPRLGRQHSRALLKILDHQTISAESMLELVQNPALPEERISSMQSYLQLLFREDIRAETIEKLNPFHSFEYHTKNEQRTLHFAFQRIYRGRQIRAVMVSVQDRTREIKLAAELERNRLTAQSRMERLFQILQIDPARLRQFTWSLDAGLEMMNAILAQNESDLRPVALEAKLLELFRCAHTMKGEANLLQLEFMEEELHAFEQRIEQIRGTQLTGTAFLPIVRGIHALHERRADLVELLDRLLQFYTGWAPDTPPAADSWLADLVADADKLARSEGKTVRFESQEFSLPPVPPEAQELLREILIQLLRNAIAHGLEIPADRRAAGKAEEGLVTIRTLDRDTPAAPGTRNERIRFTVTDDGRGLQFEQIRERLLERAAPDERAQIVDWSEDQLAEQIFEPGLSIRSPDAVDALGGRGIGMDLVRARLRQHAGQIRVRSVTGRYTEFEITLPLNDRSVEPENS